MTPATKQRLDSMLESLHQRVHILERALAAMVALATDEQRQIVVKMMDQAEASYSPTIIKWPEMQSTTRKDMARVVAGYKALFSA